METAKKLFGCKGDITEYIIRLDVGVENTTWAEVEAMHRPPGGRPQSATDAGGRLRSLPLKRFLSRHCRRGDAGAGAGAAPSTRIFAAGSSILPRLAGLRARQAPRPRRPPIGGGDKGLLG